MSLICLVFNIKRYKKVGVNHEHSVVIINMLRREQIEYVLVLYAATFTDFRDKNNFVGLLKLCYW